MILLKTEEQIGGIRKSCKLLAQLFETLNGRIVAGMSTYDIDQICHDFIIKHGGKPAFLHYEGFPKSCCISINEVVCHGIPSKKTILKEGDIVNIDIPAYSISINVSDEELEKRRKEYVKPEPKIKSGWLERYSRLVSSSNTGAVMK